MAVSRIARYLCGIVALPVLVGMRYTVPRKRSEVVVVSIGGVVLAGSDTSSAMHGCQTITTTNTRINAPRVHSMHHRASRAWPTMPRHRIHILALRTWNTPETHIHIYTLIYTLCLKNVPTFKLSVTLSNLNRFSKFLHCWKAYEICYKTRMKLPISL